MIGAATPRQRSMVMSRKAYAAWSPYGWWSLTWVLSQVSRSWQGSEEPRSALSGGIEPGAAMTRRTRYASTSETVVKVCSRLEVEETTWSG